MRITSFISVIAFLFFSCTSSKCIDGKGYAQFKIIFNTENELFEKSGEIKFKNKLLHEMCSTIAERNKVLLIEEINTFSGSRNGLIYIFDDNSLYYFLGNRGNKIKLGKGDNNLVALSRILNKIKPDFINEAKKLKNDFEKMSIHDAPLLQLILMDTNGENIYFEFQYSPNFVLENKL